MEGETSWVIHCFDDIVRDVGEFDTFSELSDEGNKDAMVVSLDLILPDDLLERILSYLPIASIFRAGCVCKRWNEIVSSERFLWNRSHVSSQKPWYFMFTSSDEPIGYAYDPILRKWYGIELPRIQTSSCFITSSRGLVCFMDNDSRSELHVCNPITKYCKRLEEPPGLKFSDYSALAISVNSMSRNYNVSSLQPRTELSILSLENVRNSEDAEKANLKSKQDLISLELCWSRGNEENIPKNVEYVLDSLQPNPNLKRLAIRFFQGSKFPNWMLGLVLKNLVEMSLVHCERWEHLPPLGKLPSLKSLHIMGMCSLKYFDRESYGDGENSFPALESLRLHDMSSLEEWTTVDRGEIFPCLRELVVDGCPKLTKLLFLPTLETLEIAGKGNEMLIRWAINLTSISNFEIRDSELKILPDGLFQNHKALKYLRLDGCCELENLSGLENLNSLETLAIYGCDNLTSLPEQGLQGLTSLRSLRIRSCKKLISLSEGMQYLTVLRNLDISHCPEMQSFPDGCKSLKSLDIWGCPQLERRCKKQTGEDWLKIAHVPNIKIKGEEVQRLDW